MSQIIDSVPAAFADVIVCAYVNASSKIQIVRVTNITSWYFERVVFPGQHLVFEAPAAALLEVHCGMMASAILSDTIPCERLQMQDDEIPAGFMASEAEAAEAAESVERDEVSDRANRSKVQELIPAAPIAS